MNKFNIEKDIAQHIKKEVCCRSIKLLEFVLMR